MKKIAVLVSGRGSNLKALYGAIEQGKLEAEICLVVSNKSKAPALEFCRDKNIPYQVCKLKDFESREVFFDHLAGILAPSNADLVVLAGFMMLVTPNFIRRFKNRVINIHPSLLPSFPGLDAQQQAFDYGVKVSGCTVFIVDEGCDTGPILIQKPVEVLETDTEETFADRILSVEHDTLWRACKIMLDGRVSVSGRKTLIKEDQ
ncbi:MAG TPA: phosphoribosylglycinamide formyltransferase [Caldisericia bacterium]|nr:phosphoribosylglycinamide formyltransferase [Caldisericia bacterium]HOR46988.1 phosphoribosylglycinamide formyltransferase [Caldisericia bacterium]HOU07925.1 phosphoribosylglycinamide formyltransferase [Caldisericia bacterium]HPL90108.1 phosphoribosylglycinamide formyltransferase [Caldisericia bacterium]HQG60343.1 phosphoribosylglycinamide formyltransferase [Caldisericia bacterium]